MSPASSARRSSADVGDNPTKILDSTRPYISKKADPAVRHMRALAGGDSSAIDGRFSARTSDSGEALSSYWNRLRRAGAATNDKRTRSSSFQGVRCRIHLFIHKGRTFRGRLRLYGRSISCSIE